MNKFKIGDRVILKGEDRLAVTTGQTGKVIEDDPAPYVEWDHSHEHLYEVDEYQNVFCISENDLELELPEINDQPELPLEAEVVKFPRETDTDVAIIDTPCEDWDEHEIRDEDILLNITEMAATMPKGVTVTITING